MSSWLIARMSPPGMPSITTSGLWLALTDTMPRSWKSLLLLGLALPEMVSPGTLPWSAVAMVEPPMPAVRSSPLIEVMDEVTDFFSIVL